MSYISVFIWWSVSVSAASRNAAAPFVLAPPTDAGEQRQKIPNSQSGCVYEPPADLSPESSGIMAPGRERSSCNLRFIFRSEVRGRLGAAMGGKSETWKRNPTWFRLKC